MLNILVALRLWSHFWQGQRIVIQCDNQAVVSTLRSGRTKDVLLAAIARNILFLCASRDLEVNFIHILGKNNRAADLLSRWQNTSEQIQELVQLVPNFIWCEVHESMLNIDWDM